MIKGKVFKYGDNVNTDVIYPGKYVYTIMDPEEMAEHALEDLDPDFVKNVEKGDIIVAGKNFGCGSSREQAVTCLKHAGVSAIIAKSFAMSEACRSISHNSEVFCKDILQKLYKQWLDSRNMQGSFRIHKEWRCSEYRCFKRKYFCR